MRSKAVFSSCSNYRFWLRRKWKIEGPFGVFLLINPSYADALRLDRTNRICIRLAYRWGWRGFGIVNLNPYRKSTPDKLPTIPDVLRPTNDKWIIRSRSLADIFILAVGNDYHAEMKSIITRLSLSGPFYAINEKNKEGGYPHPMSCLFRNNYPKSPTKITCLV
jgi:hypothetical protein